ncbi:putative nuclease HARBI1 [Eupeodes corollae]|uniref:putative nuclease HARBI1 n=1 Tax=Eupeodes corollae TaxID=290404 RepID=UPI0024903556|nr:putative nuclease HARBI1 [Eupeodes corollae]
MEVDFLLINELMSSSSSSSSSSTSSSSSSSSSSSFSSEQSFMDTFSDEDFFELQKLYYSFERQSVKNFVRDVVGNYSDEEFHKYFRVSRQTASTLTQQYCNSKHYRRKVKCGGRKESTAESQCLSFLWFAANKNTYREVAQLFNVSLSSAYRHQTAFLEFLFDLSKQHIRMPSSNSEKDEKSKAFAQIAGLPNVLGCIDCCSVCIRNPAKKDRSIYENSAGQLSITLQAICDADKKFLDVYVGASSKIHDYQVFQMSNISKDLPKICGKKYHLLGDNAYPLREYLLNPYRDGYDHLSIQQEKFNKKHSQTFQTIDNTFGLLKERFRQLTHLDFFTVSRMSKFVLGCCVLHNICIEKGDIWIQENKATTIANEDQKEAVFVKEEEPSILESMSLHNGQMKRYEITQGL